MSTYLIKGTVSFGNVSCTKIGWIRIKPMPLSLSEDDQVYADIYHKVLHVNNEFLGRLEDNHNYDFI
jgi:hypothetical protein